MDPCHHAHFTPELPESVLATLAEIGEEINASLNLDRVLAKICGHGQAPDRLRNLLGDAARSRNADASRTASPSDTAAK